MVCTKYCVLMTVATLDSRQSCVAQAVEKKRIAAVSDDGYLGPCLLVMTGHELLMDSRFSESIADGQICPASEHSIDLSGQHTPDCQLEC